MWALTMPSTWMRKSSALQAKMRQEIKSIFKNLTPWQISQLSRHPLRPYTLDYVEKIFDEFHELHGDRAFADDHAIVGGLARFRGRALVFIGQQKGRDTKAKIFRNFGMPRPEGYRKALRLMNMAARFRLPLVTFHRHAGRLPGRRRRGTGPVRGDRPQPAGSVAIARTHRLHDHRGRWLRRSAWPSASVTGSTCWSTAPTPSSPRRAALPSCGRTQRTPRKRRPRSASPPTSLKKLGLVDEVIGEPLGGAHKEPDEVAARIADCLEQQLDELSALTTDQLLEQRYQRLLSYGEFQD